jgi:hypothetical protein
MRKGFLTTLIALTCFVHAWGQATSQPTTASAPSSGTCPTTSQGCTCPTTSQATTQFAKLFPICEKGKWGYIDAKGKVVVQPQYQEADKFSEGLGAVYDGTWYFFIDAKGDKAMSLNFPEMPLHFQEGFALVRDKAKYAYIDKAGKTLHKFKFQPAVEFEDGDSSTVDDGITGFHEGLAPAAEGDKWGYIDTTGKLVIKAEYDSTGPFSEGLACVFKGGKYGYIDAKGNFAIPPQYESAGDFHDGLAYVALDEKYGFIDKQGTVAIPCTDRQYESVCDFAEHLASFSIDVDEGERYGFMDKKGNVVITPKFDDVGDFCCHLAPAQKDDKWGYIDQKGQWVIAPQFASAEPFEEPGVAHVTVGGTDDADGPEKAGYIDLHGIFIWGPKETEEPGGGDDHPVSPVECIWWSR